MMLNSGLWFIGMLTNHGFNVETAEDGLDGVGKALEIKPDLILLDIYLPRLDGFGVLQRLKGDPDTWAIPVVAISAWPTGDNRRRSTRGRRGRLRRQTFPGGFAYQPPPDITWPG